MLKLLRSRALALGLLIFVFVAVTVGMIVPQESLMPPSAYLRFKSGGSVPFWLDFLGLTRLFTSWWFLLATGLVLLNLAFCTWDQFRVLSRSPAASPWGRRRARRYEAAKAPDEIASAAAAELESAGFTVSSASDRPLVVGEQHRPGRYGTVLFHFGIILTFVGFLASQLAGFRGEAQIAEGQPFAEEHSSYQRLWEGPLFGERHSRLVFVADKMNPWYTRLGYAPDLRSAVSAYEPGGRRIAGQTVMLNVPLNVNGLSLANGTMSGYTVFLKVEPSDGSRAMVQSANLPYQGNDRTDAAEFGFPGLPYDVTMWLRPVTTAPAGTLRFRGPFPRPRRPTLEVMLGRGGRTLASRSLPLGGSLKVGGDRFTFLDLKYWSVFSVSYDPGGPLIEFAFLIGCVGLVLRYVWEQRRIRVQVGERDGRTVVKVSAGEWYWLAEDDSKYGRLRRGLESAIGS